MSRKTVRIEHRDNIIDIVEKVNDLLREFDIRIEDDGEVHDGFIVLGVKINGEEV